MQPYQQASDELRRRGEAPLRAVGKIAETGLDIASTGLKYGGGAALFKRILPLLSKYVPEDLAKKGLNKINPGFGKFIDKAESEGSDFEEIKDFIKQKGEETLEQEKPKENRNIIEQYSPELHQFISEQVKSGRRPIEAGAIAQNYKKFSDVIKKLSKDHKTNWSSIIESVYGTEESAQPSQAQQPQNDPMQAQQQAQNQSQGIGKGEQAILNFMQGAKQKYGI
jgi:hypothetical protein